MAIRFVCCLLMLIAAATSFADEQVRQVQEELRRRNLYFGDIDGQATPELAAALKRYQERKGFAVTGQIDEVTANSLSVVATLSTTPRTRLPDVPVLKSDSARELPDAQRIALEKQAAENVDLPPAPAPPAEEPPPSQDLSPERVTQFVQQYLRDAETDDVEAQIQYFAFPVEYFDHGQIVRDFAKKDVTNYVRRWPERKYTLTEPVSFVASSNEDETMVEFTIAFNVRNKDHVATGRTRNLWTVRPEGEDLKIISIREQRLRER